MISPVNPDIFKAYDVAGCTRQTSMKRSFGRSAGVRGLPERRADRRLARHASVFPGAGRGVHRRRAHARGRRPSDYGLMGTDMLYYAVARDGHDGGAQITASHNPKQYNGVKLVREAAFPLSGDAGISEVRDMIVAGTIPDPRGPPRHARR